MAQDGRIRAGLAAWAARVALRVSLPVALLVSFPLALLAPAAPARAADAPPAPLAADERAASAAQAPTSGADCPPDAAPLAREDVVAGMRDAVDSGFLWKAVKDGRTVYLYGTIHIAQREWMFPGPRVLAALRESPDLAFELDPTDPQIVARLQRAIGRKAGAPELPAKLRARLAAQEAAACVAPAQLAGLRPEMQAVTLEVMSGRRLGLQPAYGIDIFLAQLGRQMHKTLHSIETPEAQAALLVSDDPRKTARNVEEVLEELEGGNGSRILGRLSQAWRHGDLEGLSSYAEWCECLKTPEQRADFAKLVDERNPVMAERIAALHAQGKSLFVAVGSLHMVGAIGLPALLRARGFEVERVALEPAAPAP
jgi:uncharacterized protein YbaP (TraB family)